MFKCDHDYRIAFHKESPNVDPILNRIQFHETTFHNKDEFVSKLTAAVKALGFPKDKIEIEWPYSTSTWLELKLAVEWEKKSDAGAAASSSSSQKVKREVETPEQSAAPLSSIKRPRVGK